MRILRIFSLLSLCWVAQGAFPDWLVTEVDWPVSVTHQEADTLVMTNGLITRKFLLSPGLVTIDFYSHEKNSSVLRALGPEAKVRLDGIEYNVGGVNYSVPLSHSYLNRTALGGTLKPDPNSFRFHSYQVLPPEVPYPYKPMRHAPKNIAWPPKGSQLVLKFVAPEETPFKTHKNLVVSVHYEMYVGHPIISKWVTIESNFIAKERVEATIVEVESLAVNFQWAPDTVIGHQFEFRVGGYNWLQVATDQPHGSLVSWTNEEARDPGSIQPLVQVGYDSDFSIALDQHQNHLSSFRVIELLSGSSDRERQGLALRRQLRLLAPQTMESPIYFHTIKSDSASFHSVVDQCAAVGFEMIFYSFGSGFDLEAIVDNPERLKALKEDIAYANSKGIEVGGYDLIALSRVVSEKWMAINNDTVKSACFASGWHDELLSKVLKIHEIANLTAVETDGPYGGYSCSSTSHSHHNDLSDSIYYQNRFQGDFFRELRKRNIYINQPDAYFYQGGNKDGMGYNEEQYSLPRWTDLSISRQGMFDDTFSRIPTQGWMFLPITNYEGGGPAAAFEPLSQHLTEYNFALGQYFGAGVAACYRGFRLFDTEETKAVVKKWVDFYKQYRTILSGDLIHFRRADMQSIDGFLHVTRVEDRKSTSEKGLAMFFNPTGDHLGSWISLPLYYTGLATRAVISHMGQANASETFDMNRDFSVDLFVEMEPQSVTWYLIQDDIS